MINSAQYLDRLKHVINNLDCQAIDRAISLIYDTWQAGQQIIVMGNGGSAITALHFINDWNKCVFMKHLKPFKGRTLVDNIGLVTSYANDVAYDKIFVEQLKNILTPNDLVIAISGSGNSSNIIAAVEYANQHSAITLGLCGYDGGKLKSLVSHVVWANVNDMQLSEDIHAVFGHMVMQVLLDPNYIG
jgi:D-sedoheptulose 7-phosphate isomerase